MSDEKLTREELIRKAEKPGRDAMRLHPFYQGKIQVMAKCVVRNMDDFAIWYTPGVAKPCLAIKDDPLTVFEHTNKGNFVAVVSDGTRVLGLGDIGPEAAMPVMEGKALLFKYLGGVDAFPICVDTKDPDELIDFVLKLQPSFGGINLEDISQPKCFYILDELRKRAHIPVWHDDQQGTAAVTVAGLINAVKLVNKKLSEIKVAMVGAGAANIRVAHQMFLAGVKPENVIMVDSKGIIHTEREDAEILATKYKEKWELAQITNPDKISGGIPEAMKDADVVIALSKPGPGVIEPEWVKLMARDPILFVCANPVPEIYPWDAKAAGAKIVATGRSDFPNQVNNSLGFPGIFRGALDVRAKTITDEMCLAAAYELAKVAEDKGLREDYIIPLMEEWEVFPREAVAVALKAIEQGVARVKRTKDELMRMAEEKIRSAREQVHLLMKEGYIPPPPNDED
ncbi:MAG TPA: NADP-dependent malic enzyme [candidate division Zixibacteria bacterium]|nr:NADP-dependent malic enzyme [candidate division Zixibacteria bacterium]